MEGIPQDVVQQHNQRVMTQLQHAEAERRAATGNPAPGSMSGNGLKKPKVETGEELKARLAAHKARMAEKARLAAGGAPSMDTPTSEDNGSQPSGPSPSLMSQPLPTTQRSGPPASYPAISLPQYPTLGASQSPPPHQPPQQFFPGQFLNGFPPSHPGLPAYPPNPGFLQNPQPMQPYMHGQPFMALPYPFPAYAGPGAINSPSPVGSGAFPIPFSGPPFAASHYPQAPIPSLGNQLPRAFDGSNINFVTQRTGPLLQSGPSPVQTVVQTPAPQSPVTKPDLNVQADTEAKLSINQIATSATSSSLKDADKPEASTEATTTKKSSSEVKAEKKEKDKSSSRLVYSDNLTSPEEKMASLARYSFTPIATDASVPITA